MPRKPKRKRSNLLKTANWDDRVLNQCYDDAVNSIGKILSNEIPQQTSDFYVNSNKMENLEEGEILSSEAESEDLDNSVKNQPDNQIPKKNESAIINPLVPPIPQSIQLDAYPVNEETLHSMLTSWYMCGFHTGFYMGRNHSN